MNILTTLAQSSYDYSYDTYEYSSNVSSTDEATAAVFGVFAFLFMFFMIAVMYVVMSLLTMRIFKKAGVEGWKAWVPFYNHWILLELGNQKGFWAVLTIVPLVNIVSAVFTYIAMYHIGLKLGKDGAFVLWAIFIPIVWYIWLAVDDSTWEGRKATDKKQTPPANV
ncbi:DUF5684 domain-containing protein [Streptomyces caniscabiei]|uniref:DUF5684 domain-containing protein n=1 Tax=Streptomyces caniscabiei TaxID=2746961 RepID=UPI0029BA8B18|nr:DUF5684 domain-containing protein [Streptomyces caniscabiei]MDX2776645.1 DUF5684 domain-containing protein [Streptomyces caniscabiei]